MLKPTENAKGAPVMAGLIDKGLDSKNCRAWEEKKGKKGKNKNKNKKKAKSTRLLLSLTAVHSRAGYSIHLCRTTGPRETRNNNQQWERL